MARVRLAAYAALLVLVLGAASWPPPGPRSVVMRAAAAVGWPPSAGLLIGEVVTGGASASDEYVELVNAGAAETDLAGLEVVYASSSGATVTRKATWVVSTVLAPGQHLLLANALGMFAGIADATYSGGFSATGGSVALRPVGGMPVDAVGWGDAVNELVEGTAAPAPVAGSSIERRPGSDVVGIQDTNDNSADFLLNDAPDPQGLGWQPSPSQSPSPTPSPSAIPTPASTPTATPTAAPTASPAPSPTPSPSASPSPSPIPTVVPTPTAVPTSTPSPTPTPTVSPTPTPSPSTAPTPLPSPTPTPTLAPSPTPNPSAAPVTVAAARLVPVGGSTLVRGVVMAEAGRLGTPPLFVIGDATADCRSASPTARWRRREGRWSSSVARSPTPTGRPSSGSCRAAS